MLVCDICGEDLVQSGNDCIFSCIKPMLYPQSDVTLNKKHFVCHVNPDYSPRYKKLNIYPYIFQLFYEDNKSLVSMYLKPSTVGYSKIDKVLEIDGILDMPWHDSKLLIQKLKLYSIFS